MSSRFPRHHCRQKGCPNTYTHIIGADNSWGDGRGGDCLPCFYAAQLHENGQTPEMIEQVPHLMEMFLPHLDEAGWTWEHVKTSYERKPVLF